jgi:hypothetical protein
MTTNTTGGSTAAPSSAPSNSSQYAPTSANTVSNNAGNSVSQNAQQTGSVAESHPSKDGNQTLENKGVENPYKGSKHKVKIANKESEIEYDELIRGYQTNQHAMNQMNEANKQRKMAEAVLQSFKEDPAKAASILGVDANTWAEQFLAREAELALKTPEERERMKLLDELKTYKDRETESKKAQEQAKLAERQAQIGQQLDVDITQALEKSGLPRTKSTVDRMCRYMIDAYNAGYADITADEVVHHVKQDYQTEHQQLWGSSDLEQLYQQLGKENVKRIIKMHNADVKKESEPRASSHSGAAPITRKKGEPKETFDEVLRKARGGRRF